MKKFLSVALFFFGCTCLSYATVYPAITKPIAVTQVVWTSTENGYNRCVSFWDSGGPLVYGELLTVKYWQAPNKYVVYAGLIAPDKHYKWRISNDSLYVRWYGTTLESVYPLHPYGSTAQYAYVLQVTQPDVVLKVNGLPGEYRKGSKVPLIPITGGSGEFTFSGPADSAIGLWFRSIKLDYYVP